MINKAVGLGLGIVAGWLALVMLRFWGFYFPLVRTNLDMEAPVPLVELVRQYVDSFLTEWWGMLVLAFLGLLSATFGVLSWRCMSVARAKDD